MMQTTATPPPNPIPPPQPHAGAPSRGGDVAVFDINQPT